MSTTYVINRYISNLSTLANYLAVKANLVASFVDSPALSIQDTLAYRYFRAYRGTDLPLTTTANTINAVSLPSLGVTDLNYYSPAPDSGYVSITKSGVYLLLAKVGAYCPSVLSVGADAVSLQIICASGACYYEGTSTVATVLTTTAKPRPLNSDRVINSPFLHTSGSGSVTMGVSGTVYALSKLTVSKTSGTDASVAEYDLLLNGVPLTGNGQVFTKSVSSSGNKTTVINSGTLDVSAGDVISSQALISKGTNLTATAGDSGLILMYLSTVNNMDNLYTGDVSIKCRLAL